MGPVSPDLSQLHYDIEKWVPRVTPRCHYKPLFRESAMDLNFSLPVGTL